MTHMHETIDQPTLPDASSRTTAALTAYAQPKCLLHERSDARRDGRGESMLTAGASEPPPAPRMDRVCMSAARLAL